MLKNKPRNKWSLPYRNTTIPFVKNVIEILYNLFGETKAVLETETFKNFYKTLSRRERAEYYPEFDIIDGEVVRLLSIIKTKPCPKCGHQCHTTDHKTKQFGLKSQYNGCVCERTWPVVMNEYGEELNTSKNPDYECLECGYSWHDLITESGIELKNPYNIKEKKLPEKELRDFSKEEQRRWVDELTELENVRYFVDDKCEINTATEKWATGDLKYTFDELTGFALQEVNFMGHFGYFSKTSPKSLSSKNLKTLKYSVTENKYIPIKVGGEEFKEKYIPPTDFSGTQEQYQKSWQVVDSMINDKRKNTLKKIINKLDYTRYRKAVEIYYFKKTKVVKDSRRHTNERIQEFNKKNDTQPVKYSPNARTGEPIDKFVEIAETLLNEDTGEPLELASARKLLYRVNERLRNIFLGVEILVLVDQLDIKDSYLLYPSMKVSISKKGDKE